MARTVGLVFPAPIAEQETPKTKAEIKALLDKKGVAYPSNATLAQLKKLL